VLPSKQRIIDVAVSAYHNGLDWIGLDEYSVVGTKRPEREHDHSHPLSREVKNARNYTCPICERGVVLDSVKEDF
jgi:hypothetical protein